MDQLIGEYEVRLIEAECAPGSARYGAQIVPDRDISRLFPYLNAVMNNARYDHENQVLILREAEQAYALRPREIRIARASDWSQAQQIAAGIAEKFNGIWQQRDSITPRFSERRQPAVIDIYKLLPRSNCQDCGYLTCLAFAADLCQGKTPLEQCPPLAEESREKIMALFATD